MKEGNPESGEVREKSEGMGLVGHLSKPKTLARGLTMPPIFEMKRFLLHRIGNVGALLVCLLIVSACASGHVAVVNKANRSYRVTNVQSSEEGRSTAPAEIASRFQRLLDEALYSEKHFARGSELKIKWQIAAYDEGSRALRYMVGFGAGKGKVVVKARFFDANNRELGSIQSEGSITMGAFGGSYETALRECADAIANYAKQNFYGIR